MTRSERRRRIHDLDATIRVGKRGIDAVTEEVSDQLQTADFVKVKFLRSARGGTDTDELADDLADAVGASVVETRGHTAVFER